jgi:hypothetical protein
MTDGDHMLLSESWARQITFLVVPLRRVGRRHWHVDSALIHVEWNIVQFGL